MLNNKVKSINIIICKHNHYYLYPL